MEKELNRKYFTFSLFLSVVLMFSIKALALTGVSDIGNVLEAPKSGDYVATQTVVIRSGDLELQMTVNETVIPIGDSAGITLTLKNVGNATVTIQFRSSQVFDTLLCGSDYSVRWSHDKCFLMIVWDLVLDPGEAFNQTLLWNFYRYNRESGQYTPPPPGQYYLTGMCVGNGMTTPPLPIELVGRLICSVSSPVNFCIADSEGRHTGYDPETGNWVAEIPNSECLKDQSLVKILRPHVTSIDTRAASSPNGYDTKIEVIEYYPYVLELVGTDEGSYSLEIVNDVGYKFVGILNGTIKNGERKQFWVYIYNNHVICQNHPSPAAIVYTLGIAVVFPADGTDPESYSRRFGHIVSR